MRLLLTSVLLLLLAPTGFAQTNHIVVTGGEVGCGGITTPLSLSFAEWVDSDLEPDWVYAVAPGPNGRLFGLLPSFDSPTELPKALHVAELHRSGSRTQLTAPVTGMPIALVVDGTGAMYVMYRTFGTPGQRIAVYNRDGSPRVTWNLGSLTGIWGASPGGATLMDLAADGCTLFFVQNDAIRRFDVCTGSFLPDFATTQISPAVAIRILPGGGVLVTTGAGAFPNNGAFQLERYAADGSFVRSYPAARASQALLLLENGERVMYGAWGCSPAGRLVTLNLATGAVEQTVNLEVIIDPDTLAATRSWTAAIGNTHIAAVPAAGVTALIAVAMLLVFVGLIRLR